MRWISVNTRKPEQETLVLVYAPNCKIIGKVLIGQYYLSSPGFQEAWTVYDFHESKLSEPVTHQGRLFCKDHNQS